MGELRDWTIAAANNNFATTEGGMPEGMDYRDVNNAARERMAAIRRWLEDGNGTLQATTPSANVYTMTPNADLTPRPGGTLVQDGLVYAFTVDEQNTGTATLQVTDGTTTVGPYEVWSNESLSAALAGDLRLNAIHMVMLRQIGGTWRWLLMNPVAGVNAELRTINEISANNLYSYNSLQVENYVHVGVDDQSADPPNTVFNPTGVGNLPLLVRKNPGEAATATGNQQFGLGFLHGLSTVLGFLGFFEFDRSASSNLRLQNDINGGGVVIAGRNSGGTVIENVLTPTNISFSNDGAGSLFQLAPNGDIVLAASGNDVIRQSGLNLDLGDSALTTLDIDAATVQVNGGASNRGLLVSSSATTLGSLTGAANVQGNNVVVSSADDISLNATDEVTLDAGDTINLRVGAANEDRINVDKLPVCPIDYRTVIPSTITLTAADVGKTIIYDNRGVTNLNRRIVCTFSAPYDGARIKVIGDRFNFTGGLTIGVQFDEIEVLKDGSNEVYDFSAGADQAHSWVELIWSATASSWFFMGDGFEG